MALRTVLALLALLALSSGMATVTTDNEPTLAALMIVRDEAENLATNLPLWGDFFDAFVVAVDNRTADNTTDVLASVIPQDVPRHVFNYTFDNFGAARTLVLRETYARFSNISHILTLDPDWRPNISSLDKKDLHNDVDAYQFKIYDRSGMSTRQVNWLARHQANLSFAYYVHEDFRLPNGLPPLEAKELSWELHEVEPQVSWHNRVGHGTGSTASRSHKRYFFDLDLLQREQRDPKYTDSPHTLFYLGLVHAALMEGADGYKPPYLNPNDFQRLSADMEVHLRLHVTYLQRNAELHMDTVFFTEYVFLSIRWIAYAHQFLLLQPAAAVPWYEKCVSYAPDRVDCKIEMSRLYTFAGYHDEAWEWAKASLLTAKPAKAWTHDYMYDCVVPLQASRAALNSMGKDNFVQYNPHRFVLGYLSMQSAKERCTTLVFEPPQIFQDLETGYDTISKELNEGVLYQPDVHCIKDVSGQGADAVVDSNILVANYGSRMYCEEETTTRVDDEDDEAEANRAHYDTPESAEVEKSHNDTGILEATAEEEGKEPTVNGECRENGYVEDEIRALVMTADEQEEVPFTKQSPEADDGPNIFLKIVKEHFLSGWW